MAAVAMIFASDAFAQTTRSEEMQREIFRTFHSRVYSGQYPMPEVPVAARSSVKGNAMKSLPSDRVWFPGEWEEVKAVIVTPHYDFQVPGHENDGYWYAEPVVTGYADYYEWTSSGWQYRGMGPYIPKMLTSSAFGEVFFHIMDGIQQGGAEAWVHVERPADTALVHQTLAGMNLRHDRLRFFVGPGNSIWYRDCGPICFYYGDQDSVAMLDFIYSRHRRPLDDSIPSLLHQQMGIPNYMTKVLWEGGNCLVDGAGTVVSSDAVYTINTDTVGQLTWDGQDINTLHAEYKPALTSAQTWQALHEMLGQRATYIIPRYLYDGSTGHIDLYLDAYDENGFVYSKMPEQYSSWTDYTTCLNNIDSLCSYQSLFGRDYYVMGQLPFPSKEDGEPFANQDEYNMDYSRTYSNHTFVNNVILQPCFSEVGADGMPTAAWDRDNIELIKAAYPGYTVSPIDVRTFDGSGGAIHCVTKQIPADNPVRILHKNLHGDLGTGMQGSDIPVSAIITNKAGIAHVEVKYRVNGSEWLTMPLAGNGNRWYGHFPLQDINTVVESVEYYISATSNNGKTVTKPITASQGGYYRFTLAGDVPADSTMFDYDTTPMPMEEITFTFGSSWLTPDLSGQDTAHTSIPGVQPTSAEESFGLFYPNPAADKANIAIDLTDGSSYDVAILDQTGRTVHASTINASGRILFTIDASRLPAGVYHVVFSNARHRVVRQLIVR